MNGWIMKKTDSLIRLTIKKKSLILLSLLLFAFIIIIYYYWKFIMIEKFINLERKHRKKNIILIENVDCIFIFLFFFLII